jgi:hypothetical protein
MISHIFASIETLFIRFVQSLILGAAAWPCYSLCLVPLTGIPDASFFQVVGIIYLLMVLKIIWFVSSAMPKR